jgi:alkylated DNA repair dioxygenase AlkB
MTASNRMTQPDIQSDLFGAPASALPPGLIFHPEFLSPEDEAQLLERIGGLTFEAAQYKQYTARRRVVSFGGSYDFSRNVLKPAPPMPPWLEPLRARAAALLGVPPEAFAHAMVAEYRPGTPLGWHRDVPQFEHVVGISLVGPARMRLRPWPEQPDGNVIVLELPPRSAYVLQNDARWRWQHAIAPTRTLRYSITFRTRRQAGTRERRERI